MSSPYKVADLKKSALIQYFIITNKLKDFCENNGISQNVQHKTNHIIKEHLQCSKSQINSAKDILKSIKHNKDHANNLDELLGSVIPYYFSPATVKDETTSVSELKQLHDPHQPSSSKKDKERLHAHPIALIHKNRSDKEKYPFHERLLVFEDDQPELLYYQ